jgi:hypothetical protein
MSAVLNFFRNMNHYPILFQLLDRVSPDLPDDVNDEIARVTSSPMDDDASKHIMLILDDFMCNVCGQLMFRCRCPDD